ncbi:MAG: D-sedoheptulose-7-phosphate isomerase [Prolixibacteraceae bacterium]
MENIKKQIKEMTVIAENIFGNTNLLSEIHSISNLLKNAFLKKRKVLFCGNGGSAAQAQHLAAELSGKFKLDRRALPAEACHLNTSFLTAVSNDYQFEKAYERYIQAFGCEGDILIGLSTSGNSENIIRAFQAAQEIKITTVGFTGNSGGKLKNYSDFLVGIPSENVARIQEMHLLIGHIICERVEYELFGK